MQLPLLNSVLSSVLISGFALCLQSSDMPAVPPSFVPLVNLNRCHVHFFIPAVHEGAELPATELLEKKRKW